MLCKALNKYDYYIFTVYMMCNDGFFIVCLFHHFLFLLSQMSLGEYNIYSFKHEVGSLEEKIFTILIN